MCAKSILVKVAPQRLFDIVRVYKLREIIMSSLEDIKVALASLTDAVESFADTTTTPPTAPTITEVDISLSDGTTEKFAPEA